MTIDELIEKYSKPSILQLAGTNISIVETGKVKSDLLQLKEDLKDLATIEYNRKVKIPRFVADWIDNHFNGRLTSKWDKADLIRNQDQYISEYGSMALQDWVSDSDNFLKFVDAVSYDFEVEEEPKYYVALPHFGFMTSSQDYPFTDYKEDAAQSTENEIKELDERYLAFAVPVEEEDDG